jgi:hypothetical protein
MRLSNDFEQNYQLFLQDAIDTGVVWGIAVGEDDNLEFALCSSADDEAVDVMPFWSREAFAKEACVDEWAIYQPHAIDVDDFIDNWLPGMQKDGLLAGVNWNRDLEGIEIEPLELSLDLLETD